MANLFFLFAGAMIGAIGVALCASGRCEECAQKNQYDNSNVEFIKNLINPRSSSYEDDYAIASRNAIRAYAYGIAEVNPQLAMRLEKIASDELSRAFQSLSKDGVLAEKTS